MKPDARSVDGRRVSFDGRGDAVDETAILNHEQTTSGSRMLV